MKRTIFALAWVILTLTSSSCGVSGALILNQNQNSTQVQLSDNNYLVVDRVNGSAKVSYFLIFGGMRKKQLYANAYSNLLETANLIGGSKALINIVTEEHVGGIPPLFYKRTVTVSGHVIEFKQ